MTHFATASAVGTTVAYENRVSPHIADRDREIIRKARQPRVLAWGSLCGRFLAPCDSRLSEPSLVGAHRQGGGTLPASASSQPKPLPAAIVLGGIGLRPES